MLVILNVPLIGVWVRLLAVPYHLLFPVVLMFICLGTYSVNNSAFDVLLVMIFGALGVLMRKLAFPAAPLILGFVLGPMMEDNFRRAMLLSSGDFATFINRPISATILSIAAFIMLWSFFSTLKARRALTQG